MNLDVPERVRTLLQPTSVLETRRVRTLPDFLVLGAVVDQADCVALVPRKVANQLVRWRELRIVELNYANKHLAIDAYWTLTAGNRRGHASAKRCSRIAITSLRAGSCWRRASWTT